MSARDHVCPKCETIIKCDRVVLQCTRCGKWISYRAAHNPCAACRAKEKRSQ